MTTARAVTGEFGGMDMRERGWSTRLGFGLHGDETDYSVPRRRGPVKLGSVARNSVVAEHRHRFCEGRGIGLHAEVIAHEKGAYSVDCGGENIAFVRAGRSTVLRFKNGKVFRQEGA